MGRWITILCMILGLGCGGSTITMLDANGDPVTIEHKMGGRGCIAVDVGADKSISTVLQQDASSDWAGVRVLPSIVQIALSTMFGSRDPEPAGYEGPSAISGCSGIFGNTQETIEGGTVLRELVPIP